MVATQPLGKALCACRHIPSLGGCARKRAAAAFESYILPRRTENPRYVSACVFPLPAPSEACVRRRNAVARSISRGKTRAGVRNTQTKKNHETSRKSQRAEHRQHNEPLAKLIKPCFKTHFNIRAELTSASTGISHTGKILQINDGLRDDSRKTTTANGSDGRQNACGEALRTKPAKRSARDDGNSGTTNAEIADTQQEQHETNSSQYECNWYSPQMLTTENLQDERQQGVVVNAEVDPPVYLSTVITKTQAVFPLSNESNRFSATGRQIDSSDGRGFEPAIFHFRQSTISLLFGS